MDTTFTATQVITIIMSLGGVVAVWVKLTTRLAKIESRLDSLPTAASIVSSFTKLESDLSHLKNDLSDARTRSEHIEEMVTQMTIDSQKLEKYLNEKK